MSKQQTSPKTPLGGQSPWRSRLGSLTMNRRKIQEEEAELDIMTENLRITELTPLNKKSFSAFHPGDYQLLDGDTRSYLDPKSLAEPAVKEVIDCILDWMNHSLGGSETRVRITNLEEDMNDGMVFKLLLEKLTGKSLMMPCGDYVQSKERQNTNVEFILRIVEDITGNTLPWTPQMLLSGDLYAILSILITIIKHFQEEGSTGVPDLPKAVKVTLLKMIKQNGTLQFERQAVNLMGKDDPGKRDGFDTLIDHAPEKLHFVKQSLRKFVNNYLEPIGYPVTDFHQDFGDGVRLILLIGSLEGYFVPLYQFNMKPQTTEEKMSNVLFAFKMIEEAGLPKPRNRPSEIVHRDLKSILRLVYSLFIKYKK